MELNEEDIKLINRKKRKAYIYCILIQSVGIANVLYQLLFHFSDPWKYFVGINSSIILVSEIVYILVNRRYNQDIKYLLGHNSQKKGTKHSKK